jgi:hypothetical protein
MVKNFVPSHVSFQSSAPGLSVDSQTKTRKKSKLQARMLEERRETASPPALVGINNVFVSNKTS